MASSKSIEAKSASTVECLLGYIIKKQFISRFVKAATPCVAYSRLTIDLGLCRFLFKVFVIDYVLACLKNKELWSHVFKYLENLFTRLAKIVSSPSIILANFLQYI